MKAVKHIQRNWILFCLLGLCLLYFILRVPSLTYQPIFADEAIYIRWAQIAKAEPTLRFISLQDGKTPLFMWAMAPFLILFEDPLFAGRLLSVVAGFFTLFGVYFIGKTYFSQRTGLIGAFLVALTPFMIFFDRMALVDSMLAAFTIWSIYWALKLAHKGSWRSAVVLGVLLGGGVLTKTPGMVNIALLPLMLIFFDFKKGNLAKRLFNFGKYFLGAGFIAVCIYLVQKIDPNFSQLSSRNSDYIHPLSRLLQYPIDPLIPHLKDTVNFSYSFLGPFILLIPLILWVIYRTRSKVGVVLLVWSILPFVYELEFIKAYTARYILYCVPPLLVLGGVSLDFLLEGKLGRLGKLGPLSGPLPRLAGLGVLLLVFGWGVYFSYFLWTDLGKLPIAENERQGYFEDWTAGYGLAEIAQFLIDRSRNETIVVGTEGEFGTLPDGLVIYFDRYFHQSDSQKIIIAPGKAFISDKVRNFALEKPTYYVSNKSRFSASKGVRLIKEYPKIPGRALPQDSMLFYEVLP